MGRYFFGLVSALAVLIIATVIPSAAIADSHTVAEQIEARAVAFETAFAAGDGAAIGALYTDDGAILPPGGAIVTGPEAIGTFWQGVIDSGIARLDLIPGEVDGGGDTATEVATFEMFTADGSSAAKGKFIIIWKNDGNGWRLHRDIWNAQPPE